MVVISDIVITLLREETQNYSEILKIFSIDTIYLIAAIVAISQVSGEASPMKFISKWV